MAKKTTKAASPMLAVNPIVGDKFQEYLSGHPNVAAKLKGASNDQIIAAKQAINAGKSPADVGRAIESLVATNPANVNISQPATSNQPLNPTSPAVASGSILTTSPSNVSIPAPMGDQTANQPQNSAFDKYLQDHPKFAANYGQLTPDQQSQIQSSFATGGGDAVQGKPKEMLAQGGTTGQPTPQPDQWQQFLDSHPKFKNNYSQLGQNEQQQLQDQFAKGGAGAVKGDAKAMLDTYPHPASQGVSTTVDYTDPQSVIDAQAGANRQTLNTNLASNRINENSPFMSTGYNYDPQSGTWTRNQNLAGAGQNLLSAVNQVSTTQPWNTDLTAATKQASDAVYNQFTNRYDPIFKQQSNDFAQQMADQGIAAGTDAYNRRFQQLQQAQNDARTNAMNQSVTAGRAERESLFNQGLQGFNAPITALSNYMNAAATGQKAAATPYTTNMESPNVGQIAGQYANMDNTLKNTELAGEYGLAGVQQAGENTINSQNNQAANDAINNAPPGWRWDPNQGKWVQA